MSERETDGNETPPLADKRLAEIRANQTYYYDTMNGPTADECQEMYGADVSDLLAEVDRLRAALAASEAREAAALEIVRAVANATLSDEFTWVEAIVIGVDPERMIEKARALLASMGKTPESGKE